MPRLRFASRLLGVLAAALVLGASARATSPCGMGFLNGSAVTIDGNRAGQWSDAATSVLDSSNPCFETLLDEGGGSGTVTIYTKRFTSGGVAYLGFFFEVHDGSTFGTGAGGTLLNGERLVLLFDPNRSGGTGLENGASALQRDYRVVITHKWQSAAGDPGLVDGVTVEVYDASGSSGICGAACGSPADWQSLAPSAPPQVAVRKDLPGGYTAEVAVPLSLLGSPASDIGVAVAVINDFGACVSGVCDGYGAAFPASLAVTNANNPVTGCGCDAGMPATSWRSPDNWGTGFFTTPPADVQISRAPDWWNSNAIAAFACSETPSYAYHPSTPCRLRLKATLTNTGTSTQTRNLLFLWADHGASPSTWRVIDLVENVAVPAAGGTFSSADWGGVPAGLPNHPCVRVYILPQTFLASFPKAAILGIDTAAELAAMEAAYGVGTQQWAQKNISANTGVPSCPVAGCGVAALGTGEEMAEHGPSTRASGAPLALAEGSGRPPAGGVLVLLGLGLLAAVLRWTGQVPAARWVTGLGVAALVFSVSCRTLPLLPRATPLDAPVQFSEEDLALFRNDVAVQVQAVGSSPVLTDERPAYDFQENLGGVIQVFPAPRVMELGQLPIIFQVTNPGPQPRRIALRLGGRLPERLADAGELQMNLDFRPRLFQPGETQTVRGTLVFRRKQGDEMPPGRLNR